MSEVGKTYAFLKNRALTILPERVLRPLRMWHYGRVLPGSFTDADEPDLKVVRELVQRGTTAVDLGANIGIYTKVLSDLVGRDGNVISVEPIPQTFDVLSRNVRSFAMTNVSCVNAAIAEDSSDVMMELPDYDAGGTNFYQARVVAEQDRTPIHSRRRVRVKGTTLDALVAGAAMVSFIKCDIEGQELTCLSGAEMVFNSHDPAWLVEVWGDPDEPGTAAKQVFQIFEDRSYLPWWFDERRLIPETTG